MNYNFRTTGSEICQDEVIRLLDFSRYYDALQIPIPRNRESIMEDFCHEKFVKRNDAGNYDITNLGALVIGKNIKEFEPLGKRAVRVIRYKSSDRLDGIQRQSR